MYILIHTIFYSYLLQLQIYLLFVFAYNVAQTIHKNNPNKDIIDTDFELFMNINDRVMEINLFDTPNTVKLVADNNFLA